MFRVHLLIDGDQICQEWICSPLLELALNSLVPLVLREDVNDSAGKLTTKHLKKTYICSKLSLKLVIRQPCSHTYLEPGHKIEIIVANKNIRSIGRSNCQ